MYRITVGRANRVVRFNRILQLVYSERASQFKRAGNVDRVRQFERTRPILPDPPVKAWLQLRPNLPIQMRLPIRPSRPHRTKCSNSTEFKRIGQIRIQLNSNESKWIKFRRFKRIGQIVRAGEFLSLIHI